MRQNDWEIINLYPKYKMNRKGEVKNKKTNELLKPHKVGGREIVYLYIDSKHKVGVSINALLMTVFPQPKPSDLKPYTLIKFGPEEKIYFKDFDASWCPIDYHCVDCAWEEQILAKEQDTYFERYEIVSIPVPN